jgi:hypothetical protein
MDRYPNNWPCRICNRPFFLHLHEGDRDETDKGVEIVRHNFCFPWKTAVNKVEYYWQYNPVDNLTYVEQLANERQLS